MTLNRVIFIVAAIVGFSVLIPLISQNSGERIKEITSILSGFASITTMVIALSLYSKFGLEKSIVEKQKDTVIEFLTELSKIRFFLEGDSFIAAFSPLNFRGNHLERYYSHSIAVSVHYFEDVKEVTNYCDHLFMPLSIVEKIRKLQPYMLSMSGETLQEKTAKLITRRYSTEEREGLSFNNLINGREFSIMEYAADWDDVINECKKWIKINSMTKIELNLK